MGKRVEIKYEELPAWAKAEVVSYLGKHKAPHVFTNVDVCESTMSIAGVTDEYSARVVVGRNGEGKMVRLHSGYYESLVNARPDERAAYLGGKIDTDKDGAILTVQKGPYLNTATLYVMKDGKYAHLADNQATADLPTWLRATLRYYAGLNSRGRKDAIWRYNIDEAMVKAGAVELEKQGLVKINKRGAVTVTVEGRQVSNKDRYEMDPYRVDWAACAAEWRASK